MNSADLEVHFLVFLATFSEYGRKSLQNRSQGSASISLRQNFFFVRARSAIFYPIHLGNVEVSVTYDLRDVRNSLRERARGHKPIFLVLWASYLSVVLRAQWGFWDFFSFLLCRKCLTSTFFSHRPTFATTSANLTHVIVVPARPWYKMRFFKVARWGLSKKCINWYDISNQEAFSFTSALRASILPAI